MIEQEEPIEITMDDDEPESFWGFEIKPPYHKLFVVLLQSLGWYLVGLAVIIFYTWPYIRSFLDRRKRRIDEMEYDAKYHKDVDLATNLLVATQKARERMQEQYDREMEIARQKEEEKKQRKLQELLQLRNNTSTGRRLDDDNSGPSTSSSKSKLKSSYNPLDGAGSARYVPPKRSCCSKGGCG